MKKEVPGDGTPTKAMMLDETSNESVHHQSLMKDNHGGIIQSHSQQQHEQRHGQLLNGPTTSLSTMVATTPTTTSLTSDDVNHCGIIQPRMIGIVFLLHRLQHTTKK